MCWPCQSPSPIRPTRGDPAAAERGAGGRERRIGRLRLGLSLLIWAGGSLAGPMAGSLAVCLGLGGASEARAQVLLPEAAGPRFRVGALELVWAEPHPDHPDLGDLTPVRVRLRPTPAGWAAPTEDEPGEWVELGGPGSPPVELAPSGLARMLGAVVDGLHRKGLYGVDVRPAARDIDLEREQDLRPPERSALAVEVRVGRIERLRTIAVGDRVKGEWRIDNEIHARIRERSPLQPSGVADEDSTDLLDRRALEDYLHRLNRHSGRQVEAALSPGEEPGGVVVDYRVLESKPWYAYAQVTDTGTRRTNPWQTRLGYTHRQLSDRDDVLSIEYLNAGFDDVNAVSARYEAPFFGPERPRWMDPRPGDPEWIEWLPRERIPWWGVDRMRWEVDFGWSRSQAGRSATRIGLANDLVVSSQIQYGGRLAYELFQHRDLFVDVFGGLRLRHVEVKNRTGAGEGDAILVVPRVGLHAERIRRVSTLGADLAVRGQVAGIEQRDRDALGRDGTRDRYAILDFNLGYTTFLEPLLRPAAWRDPATEASSTLAHELALGLRGQYAFDYRLIPQSNGAIGGLYSVRGYSQSVAVGDTVVIGSLEYRFHLPRALPVRREPLQLPLVGDFRVAPQQVYGRADWDLTLRAFVDVGRTIRNDRSGNLAGVAEFNQTLIGAGVGAELTFRSNLRARVDWATALKNTNGDIANGADVGDSEVHVLFSILY